MHGESFPFGAPGLGADMLGRPMTRGMVVITGSVIPTLPIKVSENFSFTLDGLGAVTMTAV